MCGRKNELENINGVRHGIILHVGSLLLHGGKQDVGDGWVGLITTG